MLISLLISHSILLTFWIVRILSNNDSPGVANVSNVEVAPIREDADTRGATVAHICAHIAHFVICLLKAIDKRWMHFRKRWIGREVVIGQLDLQVAFNEHWKAVLEERANISTIRAVTVANREEVTVFEAHDVRVGNVGVLVYLVWVMGRDTAFGCE